MSAYSPLLGQKRTSGALLTATDFMSTRPNIWLDEINAVIGPDRLPVPLSAHLGRGTAVAGPRVYYDQFEPARQPTDWNLDAFVHEVSIGFQKLHAETQSDPAAQWTGAMRGPAFFAYANNYLIDVKFGVDHGR
jgi:hypothetical protein